MMMPPQEYSLCLPREESRSSRWNGEGASFFPGQWHPSFKVYEIYLRMISRFWGIWDIPEQWYPSFEVYEIYLDNDILLLRYMRYIWEHTVEKSQTKVKWWRCRFLPWTRTSLFQDIWDPQSNATTYTCKSVPTSPGHGNPAAQMEENETSGIRFSQFTTPLPGCTQGLQWPVGIPHTSPKLPCQS